MVKANTNAVNRAICGKRKANNIGKSETSKIGRCLRMKLRMKYGRATLPNSSDLLAEMQFDKA